MPTLLYNELQDILSNTSHKKPDIFIETGTYEAETTIRMSNYFEQVYTIEIHEPLFRECKTKCRDIPNITCIFGDSTKRLPYLVSTIKDPVVFWLDGHWSRGKTSVGEKDVPLLEELDVIYENFHVQGIIIIDDLRLFGGGPYVPHKYVDVDWSDITIENIRTRLKERTGPIFTKGDRLIIELL